MKPHKHRYGKYVNLYDMHYCEVVGCWTYLTHKDYLACKKRQSRARREK